MPTTTAGFRITTGPGPVPSLDGANVVVGRVTAGLDVVASVARTPTFAPLPSARSWNSLAAALGDGRAAKARAGAHAWLQTQSSALTRCHPRRRAARGASRGRRWSSRHAAWCSRERTRVKDATPACRALAHRVIGASSAAKRRSRIAGGQIFRFLPHLQLPPPPVSYSGTRTLAPAQAAPESAGKQVRARAKG